MPKEEEFGPDVPKRKGQTFIDKTIDALPWPINEAAKKFKEQRERITGESKKNPKKETPWGEYE